MSQSSKWIFRLIFLAALLATVFVALNLSASYHTAAIPSEPFLLIDPGHGGEDGGTSSAAGTFEKMINLSIALDMRDMLTIFGIETQMTRESDISIHDSGCVTARQKKVSDMQNRLKMFDSASMTVSIHQNHFSVAKYDGAQVFYSASNPLSITAATAVREKIVSLIQPDNKRELKKATDSIFLLYKTTKPAILVECGFLSNPTESSKLQQETYQQKMAFAITAGVLDVYRKE